MMGKTMKPQVQLVTLVCIKPQKLVTKVSSTSVYTFCGEGGVDCTVDCFTCSSVSVE